MGRWRLREPHATRWPRAQRRHEQRGGQRLGSAVRRSWRRRVASRCRCHVGRRKLRRRGGRGESRRICVPWTGAGRSASASGRTHGVIVQTSTSAFATTAEGCQPLGRRPARGWATGVSSSAARATSAVSASHACRNAVTPAAGSGPSAASMAASRPSSVMTASRSSVRCGPELKRRRSTVPLRRPTARLSAHRPTPMPPAWHRRPHRFRARQSRGPQSPPRLPAHSRVASGAGSALSVATSLPADAMAGRSGLA